MLKIYIFLKNIFNINKKFQVSKRDFYYMYYYSVDLVHMVMSLLMSSLFLVNLFSNTLKHYLRFIPS